MAILKNKNNENNELINQIKLPRLMKKYENGDYVTMLKARFVYFLNLTFIVLMATVLVNNYLLNIFSSADTKYWLDTILIFIGLLAFMGCFIILIKGRIVLSSHLLLSFSFACIWLIMFMANENANLVVKLDTIVFVFAVLSATPILVGNNKKAFIFYFGINILLVILLSVMIDKTHTAVEFNFAEFISDNIIALIFTGIVLYNVYIINNITLHKVYADVAERKHAEALLALSERKYRELTESLPQTIFETDLKGTITYVNQAGLKLFGYTEQEFKSGVNIMQTVSPVDRERAAENAKLIFQKSGKVGNSYLALKKDGTQFPIVIYSNVIENNQGPVGLRGITIDYTDLANAQQALKISENRFRYLFNNAPLSMVQISTEGLILKVNNEAIRELGFYADGALNMEHWWVNVIPDEADRRASIAKWNQDRQLAMKTKASVTNDYLITNIQGATFTMLVGTSFLDDSFIVTFFDITERKKAEMALKQNEELFISLIESLPYSVALTSLSGKIIMANNAFYNDLAIDCIDLKEKNISELGIKIINTQLIDVYNVLLEKGSIEKVELDIIDSKGVRKNLYVSSRIIHMNHQKVILTSGVNLTEKKQIENELEKYRKNLEVLVDERTKELGNLNTSLVQKNNELQTVLDNLNLAHQQIIESEKMATLGILAAGVAHEINNPLNFIHGGIIGLEDYFDQFLKDHIEAVNPLVNAINTGVDRASKIVSSLSHFSRQTDSIVEKCDLHGIIDNCLLMLENQLKYKATIVKNFTTEPFILLGNDGKLHQAIINILTNAGHALKENGMITVTTQLNDSYLTISFTDNGSGIEKSILNKIFEPFFTTKAPGIGSGLGLSITSSIIKEHKGKLEVQSEENKGTIFKISLPVIVIK